MWWEYGQRLWSWLMENLGPFMRLRQPDVPEQEVGMRVLYLAAFTLGTVLDMAGGLFGVAVLREGGASLEALAVVNLGISWLVIWWCDRQGW